MQRLVLALLLLLYAPLAAPVAAAEPQPPPPRVTQVDSARYPEVTVYVSVTDGAGQPRSGLTAAEFTLTEDGNPVDITGFSGGAGSVTAALVVDRSGSMAEAGKLRGAKDAALAFVDQMRAGDRTALLAFSDAPATLSPLGANTEQLRDEVTRLRADGGTALYDSIIAGVDALRDASGRRALLVLADGQDCRDDPRCPDEYGSRNSADDAIAYAPDAGQAVFVVGLGRRTAGDHAGVDEPMLRRIATETGGEYFYAPDASELAELYRRLAAGIQQEYALTYRSPRPFYDGTRRAIAVTVGGVGAGAADYLQQHLVHVRSNPVIGFVLLVPLVWALLLPGLIRRHNAGTRPVASAAPAAATDTTLIEAPAARVFCIECGRPMRSGARFCSGCGAPAVHSA
jgi:Ca-activated chloride channel homolog